jgi:hypothetical protein
MPNNETPFYAEIDEILAPPSRGFIIRGSSTVLLVFLLLIGVAAFFHYDEGRHGTAYFESLSSGMVESPYRPTIVRQIRVAENSRVAGGDILLILASGASGASVDTIRAGMAGSLRLLRKMSVGMELEPGVPLFFIQGRPPRYRLKLVFPGVGSSDDLIGKTATVRFDGMKGRDAGTWAVEIISQPYRDKRLGIAVVDALSIDEKTDRGSANGPALLPDSGTAFLRTGRTSLLSKLLGF